MAFRDNPYDPEIRLQSGCSCGVHANQIQHDLAKPAEALAGDQEVLVNGTVESAVMRALFPNDAMRRGFLKTVGAATALAAVSSIFPMRAAQAMANETNGPIEKKDLNVGFVPLTCATPLIMAEVLGYYRKQGLNVSLKKTASWAVVRDKVLDKELDASQMLVVQPLASRVGIGGQIQKLSGASIQNINGSAITMHLRHKDKKDPRQWKGMTLGIPFEFSMQALLLRYFLAENGLDPDKDVKLRVLPPADFVANMRSGNLDGGLFGEPFNQRVVYEEAGYIHTLSKDIWDGHPCCAFTVSDEFVKTNPNTFAALFKAVIGATEFVHDPGNRAQMVTAIAPANYLNQPIPVLEQVMTGRYADGLGNIKSAPGRIDFDPFPWDSMGVWILTQLKRWGYVKEEIDYRKISEEVFNATDARKKMLAMGFDAPAVNYKSHSIMGKNFDSSRPEAYLKSFAPFKNS
jgi:nitrate/nitrite transport system substrate-binding protein